MCRCSSKSASAKIGAMPSDAFTRRVGHVLAAGLIAAFFLQTLSSSLQKSPVFDEPPHIASGLAYIQKGVFTPNMQHPPLLKEIAALSMLLAGIRLPDTALVDAMLREPAGQGLEWAAGNLVIETAGPSRILFLARLPLILLSTLMPLLLYLWGRRMIGELAALGALFLCTFDPTVIAHSGLVTTDAGMATLAVLFFFCLWNYLGRRSVPRLLVCGLAMGFMLGAKFSAVLLPPVALLLMLAQAQITWPRLARALGDFTVMSLLAALVIMALYFSPSGLSEYFKGLHSVYNDSSPDFLAFMAGELKPRFAPYFAVAWLLKEPLATIAIVCFGSIVLLRSRRLKTIDKLFILVPPLVLFSACTLWAANIGIRYMIPAFPFLYLAGGAGAAALIHSPSKWPRGLAAVAAAWLLVAAAGIYPDHLSYFNEAACLPRDPDKLGLDGGTRCGPAWLDDSNTDWGQGLAQLAKWKKNPAASRPLRLAYFGSFPPEAYGFNRLERDFRFDLLPGPGLYAVSAKYISRFDSSWLRTARPVAVVGHAFYIYDIQ
jgi:hypothetical protein